VKLQQDFATNHKQINSFLFAPAARHDSLEQIIYPLLLTDIDSSVISDDGLSDSYVFRVIVADLLTPGLENETEVLSDCKQMINDFIAYFKQTDFPTYLTIDTNIIMTHFTQWGADDVAGWDCKITFKLYLDLDLCGIPLT
jgi:hypothetical protein